MKRSAPISRKTTITLAIGAAFALAAVAAWPSVNFLMLTGRLFSIDEVDTLRDPIPVTGWNADGLNLADGRVLALPGLHSLPSDSAALAASTKRGIEVGPDGRVRGLVQIHHWCGNDPVREHIARVDLAKMMAFLRVGEPDGTPDPEALTVDKAGGKFSEWGWDIGEFLDFQARGAIEGKSVR